MSATSIIATHIPGGRVIAFLCLTDGYPAWNGRVLQEHAASRTDADWTYLLTPRGWLCADTRYVRPTRLRPLEEILVGLPPPPWREPGWAERRRKTARERNQRADGTPRRRK